jgi:hypothetical protein
MKNTFLFLLLFSFLSGTTQKSKKEEKLILSHLQRHIQYLASDSLEGRRVGTPGEQLAMSYISSEFKKIGLLPKGSADYYQRFEINEGKQINNGTYLTVGGQSLLLHTHFIPLSFSPNISLEALPSMSIQELQMPWFFDLKETLEGATANPHFDIYTFLKNKASEVKPRGATALFVYNSSSIKDGIEFKGRDGAAMSSVPVIYLTPESVKKYFNDPEATLDLKLKIDIGAKKRVGNNVIGFLDNRAASTVVIGAHFDHLGYGEDGNSLSVSKPAQIHNGADDNASGVAALIELARLIKEPGLTGNNYLFIAFSGEELGLLGSKYFVQNATIDLKQVSYMINLDMIGRVNENNGLLSVGGFGTSPAWATAYSSTGKKGVNHASLTFKFDSSGTGPSDHTSFYQQGIPVLFFFSGVHTDYHKPSDDADKINYNGELNVMKHIYSLIEWQVKNKPQIAFTKTRETGMQGTASFSVTLGIMPDYSYDGAGLRVDGIIDNRPAQKAGLKTGDIIMQLGAHSTSSMENYMKALGTFKKGDKTTVQVMRGKELKSFPKEF